MSVLNNDNITDYLFKKEIFKARTGLYNVDDVNAGRRTLANEPYGSNTLILNKSILAEDISFNLTADAQVDSLYFDTTIPVSSWGTGDISQQTIQHLEMSTRFPSLTYLRYYNRVYLEPVQYGNRHTWWLQIDRDPLKRGKIENNYLSYMVPEGVGRSNFMYGAKIEFYVGTPGSGNWIIESFNQVPDLANNSPSANWTIDYGTGIVTLNSDKTTLDSIYSNLDATNATSEYARPRISFMKYVGATGVSGGGSGNNGGGNNSVDLDDYVTDISFNEYLFDVPKRITNVNTQITTNTQGTPEIQITWTNPPQKCAAFDFFQLNTRDYNTNTNLDQIYYADNNHGIHESDTNIFNEITRQMNKLPFHEFIRIQYKSFWIGGTLNTNWTDLPGAQVNTVTTNTATNGSSRILYPIFKETTRIIISNNGQAIPSPGPQTGLTTQDIISPGVSTSNPGGDRTYTNLNVLDASLLYHIRIAIDNRACVNGKGWWERTDQDISNNLLWYQIPEDSTTYLELGQFGPAAAPAVIYWDPVSNELPFEPDEPPNFAGTIKGEAGNNTVSTTNPTSFPVMDTSFNTVFSNNAPVNVKYGFDLSIKIYHSSLQIGDKDFSTINPPPANVSQLHYANEGIITFNDLSYETDWNKQHTFEVNIGDSTNGTWTTSNPFTTAFPYTTPPLTLALPQHTYDISNVYMMNDRFKDINNQFVKVYLVPPPPGPQFSKNSHYANLLETAEHVLGNSTYLNHLTGGNIGFTNQEDPGFDLVYNSLSGAPAGHTGSPQHIDYGDETKLKKCRDINGNVKYVIFIDQYSDLTIKFKADTSIVSPVSGKQICFITSFHDYANPLVGTQLLGAAMGEYELRHEYVPIPASQNPTLPIGVTVERAQQPTPIIGFDNVAAVFPRTYTNTSTTGALSPKIDVINDDPTGPVTGQFASIENARFGGYYNVQYITRDTGVYNITQQKFGDAFLSNYGFNAIELEQTNLMSAAQKINKIEYLLGWVARNDIIHTTPVGGLSVAIQMTRLFGINMPRSVLPFELTGLQISNIYAPWIYYDEKLIRFQLYYRGNPTLLEEKEYDWNIPVQTPQSENFSVQNVKVNAASDILRSPSYNFSRDGNEGIGPNSQFSYDVRMTNNIFSEATTNTKYLNLTVNSDTWNWGGPGIPKILWWDFTYNGVTLPNGQAPSSGFQSLKLKDPRGVVTVTQSSGSFVRHFPGYSPNQTHSGTPSTNHEWYTNNYDHTHLGNPSTLEDTQLMWCKGGFRSGFAAASGAPYTKDTNKLNPYIDYTIYYDNNVTGKNYESQGTTGESWNYDNNWATAHFGDSYYTNASTWSISGDYKFVTLVDESTNWRNGNYKSVEVYVNGNNVLDSLTLGDDYIMYICLEGPIYQQNYNTAGVHTFTDSSTQTKYRTGWLDCQLRTNVNSNVFDGTGCYIGSNQLVYNNGALRYCFKLFGLESQSPSNLANGVGIDKIFYRIGIKNDTAELDASTYNTEERSIKSVDITYSILN